MKKLMCAIAAISAGVAMADVESANIVGYQSFPIKKSQTRMFAVQFEDTATQSAIAVKDLVKYDNPQGGGGLGTGTDQIWTYKNGEGWKKYYWYQGKFDGPWWALKDTQTDIGSSVTVSAGDSFFFVRSAGTKATDVTLNVAGSVVALDGVKGIPVQKGQTILLCNPWPTSIRINEFCKYYTNPQPGGGLGTGTDQIWTYRDGVWQKYYYYQGKFDGPWWALKDTQTDIGDSKVIEPGEGFFFVRSAGSKSSDVNITFKGPEYVEATK